MAKVTARGEHMVAELTVEQTVPGKEGAPDELYHAKFRLRSDGAILRRLIWVNKPGSGYGKYRTPNQPDRLELESGYKIVAKFKPGILITPDALTSYVSKRRWTIV